MCVCVSVVKTQFLCDFVHRGQQCSGTTCSGAEKATIGPDTQPVRC